MNKKLLELFSGTGSIGKVFQRDYEVISLDYKKHFKPTICIDLLVWDYTIYPEGYFDVIWASPDCTSWSKASGGKHRVKSDMSPKTETAVIGELLILKTIEIINYFKPKYWFIENPQGLLQHFPPMKDFGHKHLVYYGNYCNPDGSQYAMVKATNIWSNIKLWENERKPIMGEDTYTEKYHTHDQIVRRFYKQYEKGSKERSVIPHTLVEKIYNHII
jgi:site-specific DNA-cytosine methylase